MTGVDGFADAVGRFSAELDAAVVRARRAAADARATSAKFRRDTRELVERVRSGQVRPPAGDLTDDQLRRSASGFRADHGLPVERLPAGRALLEPPPAPVVTPGPGPGGAVTPGPRGFTGSGRRPPRPGDDDEDFSQERIMW